MNGMSVHDFHLAGLLHVCHHLSEPEQTLVETLEGCKFDADLLAAMVFQRTGPAWLLVDEHGPVAACGFFRQRPGVLRSWFLPTERAWSEHGSAVTEWCRRTIQSTLDGRHAHRIETVTLASQTRARTWYNRIGLQHESTLRGYCSNGEDAVLYVAVSGSEGA